MQKKEKKISGKNSENLLVLNKLFLTILKKKKNKFNKHNLYLQRNSRMFEIGS